MTDNPMMGNQLAYNKAGPITLPEIIICANYQCILFQYIPIDNLKMF